MCLDLAEIFIQIIATIRNNTSSIDINKKFDEIDFLKSESYNKLVYYQQKVNKIYSKHIASTLETENIDNIKQIVLKFSRKDDLVNEYNLQGRLYTLLDKKIIFTRENHLSFVKRHLWSKCIEGCPKLLDLFFLDASQPWILYWMTHSLDLMYQSLSPTFSNM